MRTNKLFATAAVALALSVVSWQPALAVEADWRPQSVERLVKLPAGYLKKSIDQDFRNSELGEAMRAAEEDVGLKASTLTDLKDAVARSSGEVRTELRHRFLVEKRGYLELMADRNDIRRKQLRTKQRLLENLLDEMNADKGRYNPHRQALIEKQAEAQARFEQTLSKVDMQLFQDSAVPESKYSQKYAENLSAIEKLAAGIDEHRMNQAARLNGEEVTREDFVRSLITEAEAELAILRQEETILGYMAKLVALDAMALSEEGLDAEIADSDVVAASSPAAAVNLFVSND